MESQWRATMTRACQPLTAHCARSHTLLKPDQHAKIHPQLNCCHPHSLAEGAYRRTPCAQTKKYGQVQFNGAWWSREPVGSGLESTGRDK